MYLFSEGLNDLKGALFQHRRIALTLGFIDIRQRYLRSSIGPLWITISMGITVAGLGFVFGTLFNAPLKEFLPFLAVGIIIWGFITSILIEGCTTFIKNEGLIKQFSLPFHTHLFRMICGNLVILAHNLVIFPLILLLFWVPLKPVMFLALPGLFLLILNLAWLAMIFGIICTRYRDITQIVTSVTQLLFFVTPVVWQPTLMIDRGRAIFMNFNPLYHYIEIIRAPLLGQNPVLINWAVSLFSVLLGWILTMWFLSRYRARIAYWL